MERLLVTVKAILDFRIREGLGGGGGAVFNLELFCELLLVRAVVSCPVCMSIAVCSLHPVLLQQ